MDAEPFFTVVAGADALADAAAHMIVTTAREAVDACGRFTIALAGGATPRATYAQLARPPLREAMPWAATWVFFGDERAVPPDHPESNYRMANETLLSQVPLRPQQVFRMRAESGDAEAAAAEYEQTLIEVLAPRRREPPRFDLVLLGLGIDGHTASLFPGSPVLREAVRWVVSVHAAAAAIPSRLTMTLPVFNAAARVAFLAAGAEKAKVIKAVLSDKVLLPAAMVQPTDGHLSWMIDRAAASLLPAYAG